MAQETMIGGTVYEIKKGRVLIGGTEYEIKRGETLVGGTVYEIPFSHPVSLTVVGSYSSDRCYFSVDGQKIEPSSTVYGTKDNPLKMEIQSDQTLSVRVGGTDSSFTNVSLNGSVVQSGAGTYTLDITERTNVKIQFSAKMLNFKCEITTD